MGICYSTTKSIGDTEPSTHRLKSNTPELNDEAKTFLISSISSEEHKGAFAPAEPAPTPPTITSRSAPTPEVSAASVSADTEEASEHVAAGKSEDSKLTSPQSVQEPAAETEVCVAEAMVATEVKAKEEPSAANLTASSGATEPEPPVSAPGLVLTEPPAPAIAAPENLEASEPAEEMQAEISKAEAPVEVEIPVVLEGHSMEEVVEQKSVSITLDDKATGPEASLMAAPTAPPLADAGVEASELSEQTVESSVPADGVWKADRLFGVDRVGMDEYLTAEHAWSNGPYEQFKIRNRHYCTKGHKKKGVKEMSSPSGYELVSCLLIPADEKLHNVTNKYPLPPRPAGSPPAFIIVFLLPNTAPGSPRLHLLLRFERDLSKDEGVDERDLKSFTGMMDKSFTPSSTFAAERIKILPFITHGANWIMCKLVNNQPGQISAALDTQQFNGLDYLEIDIDVEGFKSGPFSALAKKILDIVRPKVASLVIDLAFMEQGNDDAELPERIIAVARLMKLNLSTSKPTDPARKNYVPSRESRSTPLKLSKKRFSWAPSSRSSHSS